MIVTNTSAQSFTIDGAYNLDPVRVYIENYEPGKGRITMACYNNAWTGYWGGMGGRDIRQFFIDCDTDYLSGSLMQGMKRPTKADESYLKRVIDAVKEAFNRQVNGRQR